MNNTSIESSNKTFRGDISLHATCKRYIWEDNVLSKSMHNLSSVQRMTLEAKVMGSLNGISSLLTAQTGIDPNEEDAWGNTVLHLACKKGNASLVELFCNHEKIDINKATKKLKKTALHLACETGSCQTIQLLSKHPALDPTIIDACGNTAFDIACGNNIVQLERKKNEKTIKLLCTLYPNILNKWGYSTFVCACRNGDTALVRFLLNCTTEQYRLNLNRKEITDALLYDCKPEIIELLLDYSKATECAEYKIDPNVKNRWGDTVFDVAYQQKDSTIQNCLRQFYPNEFNEWEKSLSTRTCLMADLLPEILKLIPNIGLLSCIELGNMKRACAYFNNTISIMDLARSILGKKFSLCSRAIITAAHEGKVDIVVELMGNDADKRLTGLKMLGLPEEYSQKDLINICQGIPIIDALKWKEVATLAKEMYLDTFNFVIDIMSHSLNPNIKDIEGDALIHALVTERSHCYGARGLKLLLNNSNTDPNVQDQNGSTPLHLACKSGYDNCVKLLCNHEKTDLNITDRWGRTPFYIACEDGDYAIIKLLCKDCRFDPSIKSEGDTTAFDMICSNRFDKKITFTDTALDIMRIKRSLEERKKDKKIIQALFLFNPNLLNEWGHSTFISACARGDVELVKFLLNETNNAERPRLNLNGQHYPHYEPTIMHLACYQDWKQEIIELLFNYSDATTLSEYKIDCNRQGSLGNTVLHGAFWKGNGALVKLFLNRPEIKLNLVDDAGDTFLHKACEGSTLEIVELLLDCSDAAHNADKKIDCNAQNKKGETVLHFACRGKNVALVTLLLKRPEIRLNLINNDGNTLLHSACKGKKPEIVKLLLDCSHAAHGADKKINYNTQNKQGETVLHLACRNSDYKTIELLLNEPGIDLNKNDSWGDTLLHIACNLRDKKMVEMLLNNHTINFRRTNNWGLTAMHTAWSDAFQYGKTEIMEIMLNNQHINFEHDFYVNTMIVPAMCAKKVALLKLLLQSNKIDINQRYEGTTILHKICSREGLEEIVTLLLSKNVDVNAADEKGHTALDVVSYNHNMNKQAILLKSGARHSWKFYKDYCKSYFATAITYATPMVLMALGPLLLSYAINNFFGAFAL